MLDLREKVLSFKDKCEKLHEEGSNVKSSSVLDVGDMLIEGDLRYLFEVIHSLRDWLKVVFRHLEAADLAVYNVGHLVPGIVQRTNAQHLLKCLRTDKKEHVNPAQDAIDEEALRVFVTFCLASLPPPSQSQPKHLTYCSFFLRSMKDTLVTEEYQAVVDYCTQAGLIDQSIIDSLQVDALNVTHKLSDAPFSDPEDNIWQPLRLAMHLMEPKILSECKVFELDPWDLWCPFYFLELRDALLQLVHRLQGVVDMTDKKDTLKLVSLCLKERAPIFFSVIRENPFGPPSKVFHQEKERLMVLCDQFYEKASLGKPPRAPTSIHEPQ